MRTRHEQMQAYRFVTRRIVSAMLSGEPETTELPMRRLGLALVCSFIVGAIVLAVMGIYGFISPAGGKPAENEIIIMRETGARFVFAAGRLHPVLNYTSAQLIVGSAATKAHTMSQRSLEKVPRGLPLGIPGAPDPVPAKKSLLGLPWSVCSTQAVGTTTVQTDLRVGSSPKGGAGLGDKGVLVTASAGDDLPVYLLLGDLRLKVDDRTVLTALELTSATPVRVGTQLLNSIPAGPDLAVVKLPKSGATSAKAVAGAAAKVGQVFRSGQQYYVMTDTGLSPVGEVMAALFMAGGSQATEVSAKQAATALATAQVEPENFPKTRPVLWSGGAVEICAVYRTSAESGNQASTGRTVAIEVFPAGNSAGDTADESTATERDGGRTADHVIVPDGRGALVRALPAPGVSAETTVYLVTDQGLSYALGANDKTKAQDALGYGGVKPVAVPTALLALIPPGPVLDPDAALAFLDAPDPTPTSSASAKPSATPKPSSAKPSTSTSPSVKTSTQPATTRPSAVTSSRRRVIAGGSRRRGPRPRTE